MESLDKCCWVNIWTTKKTNMTSQPWVASASSPWLPQTVFVDFHQCRIQPAMEHVISARKTPPFTESSHATARVRVTAWMACEKPFLNANSRPTSQSPFFKMQLDLVTRRQNTACEITVKISSHQHVISIVWIINIIFWRKPTWRPLAAAAQITAANTWWPRLWRKMRWTILELCGRQKDTKGIFTIFDNISIISEIFLKWILKLFGFSKFKRHNMWPDWLQRWEENGVWPDWLQRWEENGVQGVHIHFSRWCSATEKWEQNGVKELILTNKTKIELRKTGWAVQAPLLDLLL